MKKSLKLKILAGFMLLVSLLLVAGAVSIIEFLKLSHSVTALIEDNYKTIEASKGMLEALERTDSGILLILLGDRDEGKEVLKTAGEQFSKAFDIAQNNITEMNEDQYINNISRLYNIFFERIHETKSDRGKMGDMDWYHKEIYQSFIQVKHAVDELMALNQASMYEEATMLKEKSHRAIMPGIVAIIGALVFSVLLSFFISKYYVSPLGNLATAIKNFHPREKQLRSNIKSEDEIKKIEVEVNGLIEKLIKYQSEQKA